jgi:hypothetical protein
MACIASTSLMFLAGAAFAQDTVPDGAWSITDDKDDRAAAFISANGGQFIATAGVECAPPSTTNGPEGSSVFMSSNHPDKVKLKKNTAEVTQEQKENQPTVIVQTGGGTPGSSTARLTCDKSDVSADVKTNKEQGSFSASAKNCTCVVGDDNSQDVCDTFKDRLVQVGTDCDDSKNLSGEFDGNTIKKIKIKGKGAAEAQG